MNATPLSLAVKNGKIEIIDYLLLHGADPNIPNKYGETPLAIAVSRGSSTGWMDIVKLLVQHNADINLCNNEGRSPLFIAVSDENLPTTEYLATQGADLNVIDCKGSNPLHYAANRSYYNIVQCLVRHGCDLNVVDNRQATVLHVIARTGKAPGFDAREKGFLQTMEFMVTAGAKVNLKDKDGKTCFDHLSTKDKICLLTEIQLNQSLLEANNYALWFVVVQIECSDDVGLKLVQEMMKGDDHEELKEGTQVDCNYLSRGNYYPGKISCIQADGTYDITYDDGEKESSVTIDRIRRTFTEMELFAKLLSIVEVLVSNHPTLAAAKDADGRAAVDVASKPMKLIMQSVLLWQGRYRITEPRPEHISATCFVFKAVDEHTIDSETGQPIKVALKLMRLKDQFQREISTRDKEFNQEFVMNVLQTYPEVGSSTFDSWPDEVMDVEADATGQLTKANAEKLYLLVMPLADRNLFVALKQERWAGKNMEEVRHVFVQLVHCVEHMHQKGVLHADLKTLNIVRTTGQWKLIDLDAACVIGQETVGHKSSSAYVPPEAIYVDEKTDTACVRSVVTLIKGEAAYDLLTAHPSFDVWSLGCILYQMCTPDVKPLFQGGQDDNLVGVRKGVDNLFALAEWSPELKADKLADVSDKLARNLLSQMLHKDPLQRPSLARVLAHSFLSGKKVARLVGEKPKYDVFLSYRVASDAHHVEMLHKLLTAQGFKVYWDKLCLEPGVDWEQGFCEGLVSSRAFVPLLSRDAINHPDKAWQNFSKLTADQPNCDNVYLEHRLAVELQGLGLIEKMFPVFIGNVDATTSEYSHYFGSGCHPLLPEVSVMSVEEKLRHHMESQALGTPLVPDRTVKSVVDAITACQGAFIVGPVDATFAAAAASIAKMLTDVPVTQSPRGGTHVHQALKDTMDTKTLVAENGALIDKVTNLESEVDSLRIALASAEALIAQLKG